MNIDEAIEWLEIIKDGFHYKDLQSAIKIEGYGDCEKAIEILINEYNNLKQIEEAHRIENGQLRVELQQEKEKNQKYIIHLTDEEYRKVIDIAQKDCIKGLLDSFIVYKKLPGINQYEWYPNVDDNSNLVNEMIKIIESENKDDDKDMKIRKGIIGFKNFMDVIFDNSKEDK